MYFSNSRNRCGTHALTQKDASKSIASRSFCIKAFSRGGSRVFLFFTLSWIFDGPILSNTARLNLSRGHLIYTLHIINCQFRLVYLPFYIYKMKLKNHSFLNQKKEEIKINDGLFDFARQIAVSIQVLQQLVDNFLRLKNWKWRRTSVCVTSAVWLITP